MAKIDSVSKQFRIKSKVNNQERVYAQTEVIFLFFVTFLFGRPIGPFKRSFIIPCREKCDKCH